MTDATTVSNLTQSTEDKIRIEIERFISSRKSLMLSTINENNLPFASYAPFGIGKDCYYILISDIALHAKNLRHMPKASALIIEDEDTAGELFARMRVNYQMDAELLEVNSEAWKQGLASLVSRHGERAQNLSQLSDFKMFRLTPTSGRYVKGFGRAYAITGNSTISHLREGHKPR